MAAEQRDGSAPPPLTFPGDEQLFSALGSEALILQNKRSALTNEATNRSSLFVSIVSGSLVAAGFVLRTPYALSFLLIVLPIVLLLGTVTFFRLATIARDDRRMDLQLEWLRSGFRGLSDRGPAYLLPPAGADRRGGAARIGTVVMSAAGFVGLLDAALLGAGVALVLGIATGAPASVGSSTAGVAASLATWVLVIVWLVRGTRVDRTGPQGTPAAPPS